MTKTSYGTKDLAWGGLIVATVAGDFTDSLGVVIPSTGIYAQQASTTHTVKISSKEKTVVNEKYLPESLRFYSETKETELVLVNEEYTSEFISDYGAFGKWIDFNQGLDDTPEMVNVTLDGIEYPNLVVEETVLGPCVGNFALLNPLGGSYENTGEPFVMGVGWVELLIATDMTQSTTHTLKVAMPVTEEIVHKIDPKYLPDSLGNDNVYTKDEVDNLLANHSGLPSYSSSNNGQFLQVVNGKAAWVKVADAEGASF